VFDLSSQYYQFDDVNHTVVDIMRQYRGDFTNTPTLLDVGCGRGKLGEEIRALGYHVTGIESHPAAHAVAAARLNRVLAADLGDEDELSRTIGDERFNFILFADVLEHVPDPLSVLRRYQRFLAPAGRIVISLPNIARWDRRLAALMGHFNYAESGVMDRTHLRFFTFATAKRLVRESGMKVVLTRHAPGVVRALVPLIKAAFTRSSAGSEPDPGAILQSRPYRFYEKNILPVEYALTSVWKGALAFRIILVATLLPE
jgi:2-polyprenyl-3-methyl-5-hydroxy-6-metoxy-1,4-benzoquinol methylase